MIVYHGTADEMAGYRYLKEAADKLKASGNDVTFVPFEGAEHGFYQRNKNDGNTKRPAVNRELAAGERVSVAIALFKPSFKPGHFKIKLLGQNMT